LKLANAQITNSNGDTPFHVAAKSTNPKAILYMLNTFAPSKVGWDVEDVDRDRQGLPPLLNICAVSGNAEAVTLLIQNGADLSKNVLRDIVIESVRRPRKTAQLQTVYRAIVDNAVTWRCLEENIKAYTRASKEYNKFLRETMMWLITRPDKPSCNVIMHAIQCGASAMLQEILSTKHVFRFDGSEHGEENGEMRFDVTNFTLTTTGEKNGDVTPSCSDSKQLPKRDYSRQFDFQSYSSDMREQVEKHDSRDKGKPEHEYSKCYLQELLINRDRWSKAKILEMQPLSGLTKPYIQFVQKWYFFTGVFQLIYMILFSVYYIPSTCWLIEHFNLNASSHNCGSTDVDRSSDAKSFRSNLSWAWLVWPVMQCVGNGIVICKDLFSTCQRSRQTLSRPHVNVREQIGLTTKHILKGVLKFIGQRFPHLIALSFSISVFF